MTTEQVVIAAIRIAGALPVLRWPLAGALIAIAADLSDLFWIAVLHLGGVPGYQLFDKWLDLVYVTTFLVVAVRWRGLERNVALALCGWRLVGVALFEVSGDRLMMLAFPNVFEFWFVLVAARQHLRLQALTAETTAGWLVGLTVAKEAQEYVLHAGRWLDRYSFFEFWALVWHALTPW